MSYRRFNLRSATVQSLAGVDFYAKDSFTPGLLPTGREVIEMMVHHLMPRGKGYIQKIKQGAAEMVSGLLSEHWIWCNIYPKSMVSIAKSVLNLYDAFKNLRYTAKAKQTDTWMKSKAKPFLAMLDKGFDIAATDPEYIKKLEKVFRVKMTEAETQFHQDQIHGERKMFCDDFIDKKWAATDQRRKRDEESLEDRNNKEKDDKAERFKGVSSEEDMEVEDSELSQDDDYCESETNVEIDTTEDGKKRRRKSGATQYKRVEDMPKNWRNIRHSRNKVREEYYRTVDKLISTYHCSYEQAISAVVVVGRTMFGLDWKFFDEEGVVTVDTVPHKVTNRRVGRALEAFTLSQLVVKIMGYEGKATITMHDDGSRTQGTGSYSVQGISIDRDYYPLPTLGITKENRVNLATLKVTIINILSTVSGVTADRLWGQVDFMMTDATSHNMEVETIVSETLGVENAPSHLLCQVHPSLCFVRVLQKLWLELDAAIGPDKIFSHFAVSLSDQHVSVTEQWIDCVTRLFTHDYDHKPWCKAGEFDLYIHPLSNPAKRLIKERFNSLCYTCMVALWLDQHAPGFLEKNTHITNNLACIVRSFESLDYLRVCACLGVILLVHLVEPFLSLTSSSITSWDKLQTAFPTLYKDLQTVKPQLLLDLTTPALSFISAERFKHCLPPADLLLPAQIMIETHRQELIDLLQILLPRLAKAWDIQRGEQFGFGDSQDSASALKIADMNQNKLKSAPINNLDAERSVGSIQYELNIRGKKNLKAASAAHVKNKGQNLIQGLTMPAQFRQLVKKDEKIDKILKVWEESQEELVKEGLQEKEVANVSTDKKRNSDLALLVKEGGPFTSPDMVQEFMARPGISEKERNKRLYIEVRHAKNSSLSFPKQSEVFRLKKNYRNLESEIYSKNLCAYLSRVTCNINMNHRDFTDAILKLSNSS